MGTSQGRIHSLSQSYPRTRNSVSPIEGTARPAGLPHPSYSHGYLRYPIAVPQLDDLDGVVSQSCHAAVRELASNIWQDLLQHLTAPILIEETPHERVVTLFDNLRFRVCKRFGGITASERWTYSGAVKWKTPEEKTTVVPPLPPDGAWLHAWLSRWWPVFDEFGLNARDIFAVSAYLAPRFNRALLRSSWWRRLRYDAAAALQLDHEVLRYCRLAKTHCRSEVSLSNYNALVNKREACREIHADNPRLLWLYMLMINEGVALPDTGVVAAMKKNLLVKGQLPPLTWRLVANGHPRDFRNALNAVTGDRNIKTPLAELFTCLSLMVKLGRTRPVPLAVQQLWRHDWFEYDERTEQFWFRGAGFDRTSFRLMLDEAERRMRQGGLQKFAEGELVDVITFLSFEPIVMDSNQAKAGWSWLVKRAAEWRAIQEEQQIFHSSVSWESLLGIIDIGEWRVEPMTNAWAMRRMAIQQRNCAHSYIDDCVKGNARLFQVRNRCGKAVATVGIIRSRNLWKLFDVRGFANAPVEAHMRELGKEVARLYGRLWLLQHSGNQAKLRKMLSDTGKFACLSTANIAARIRKGWNFVIATSRRK